MKYLKIVVFFLILSNRVVAQQPQIGLITAVNEKLVTLKLVTIPADVKPATIGYVSKDLTGTKGPFGMILTSGWLDIGEVKVKSIKNNIALLEIIKEKTDIVVNGKVQKQFVVGKKIKIDWTK